MHKSSQIAANNSQYPSRGLRAVYRREWRRLMVDGTQKMLLLIIAPLWAWIFCALYGNGTIADLPIAVVDQDDSPLSRTIIRSLDATKLLHVVARAGSVEELQEGIASGKFAAGYLLPEHMTSDVKASRRTYPQLFCNGTGYLTASAIIRETQSVIKTLNAGIIKTKLTRGGLSDEQARVLIAPIGVDLSNCYNPAMNYRNYLAPGIIFAQYGAMILLAGALCFARERERHSLESLRYRSRSVLFSALHGKSLPYAFCIAMITAGVLFLLVPMYHIATVGQSLQAIPAVALYLTASWWFGAFIGILTGRTMIAASLAIGIGIPSFLFSGWTFPLSAAPSLYSYIAALLPFPHFMPLWFGAVQKGTGPFTPVNEGMILFAIVLITMVLTGGILNSLWKHSRQNGVQHV